MGEAGRCSEVEDFLVDLRARGRSDYTLRSYGQALGHFTRWLTREGLELEQTTRSRIATYIDEFSRAPLEGAVAFRSKSDAGQPTRKASTINHRLSVLGSFFSFLIERDEERGQGPWRGRKNPVPQSPPLGRRPVIVGGRDAPRRGPRAELRRALPHELPKGLDGELAEQLIDSARSARDKAILALLLGAGQRIGDWPDEPRRHGVLGMRLEDFDEKAGLITVRLKGTRAEHRVPCGAGFWAPWRHYLNSERPADSPTPAAWVGFRRGAGRPLRYAAFERALRTLAAEAGAEVHAHMFRHTLAQILVAGSGLAVAQRQLGHRHISSTTAYAHVEQGAMVEAIAAAESQRQREKDQPAPAGAHAFPYSPKTIAELDALADSRRGEFDEL
jgi:site-specific recombinase XerD